MLNKINVTIYKPTQSAMQSGLKACWKIKFPNDDSKYNYNLMSWTGSKNTRQQLNLNFETKEQAIEFAKKRNWVYTIIEPKKRKILPKSYATNFLD